MKKIAQNIWGRTLVVGIQTISGKVNSVTLSVRIKKELDGYRVDRGTVYGPWEAIDNGEPCSSLAKAQGIAIAYVKAVRAQQTLTPHQ